MVLGKLVIYIQKTEIDLYLSLCTRINSKWIKDPNVKPEITGKNRENSGRCWPR
jgi:hypothetical protein